MRITPTIRRLVQDDEYRRLIFAVVEAETALRVAQHQLANFKAHERNMIRQHRQTKNEPYHLDTPSLVKRNVVK